MCVYLDFSTKDTDECSRLKPCSHECSNTAGGYRCSCPLGLTLNQDAKTCSGNIFFHFLLHKFLLYWCGGELR